MDLVKARKKAREKAGKKKTKDRSAPEMIEERTEAPAAPAEPTPEQTRPAAPAPPVKEPPQPALPSEEVFQDTAFGEDLPPVKEEEGNLDDLILGSLEDDLRGRTHSGADLELASEDDVEELAFEPDPPPKPKPARKESKPAKPAAKPAPQPAAKPAAKPKAPEPPPREEWVVGDAPEEEGSGARRVEMDWEDGPDVFSLSELAPEDEDFFSLVTEDLYQREFGRFEDAEKGHHLALLSFRLAKEVYAVPLTSIKQIIKMLPVTRVPRVPGHVLGIISLRGTIIPIFDLRRVLQLTAGETTRKTRIVIVAEGKFTVGLVVDEVEQVVRFPESKIEPPPPVMGGGEADYIKGISRVGAKMIILLALEKILIPVMSVKAGG